MRRKMFAAALLAVTAGSVLATPAHASTVAECRPLVEGLGDHTEDAGLPRLADKADAAVLKLDQNKIADALAKLRDYDATLEALRAAPKPKVDPDIANALDIEVGSAIDCVVGISS